MDERIIDCTIEGLQERRRSIYADVEKLLADAGCQDDITSTVINMMRDLETITEMRVVKTI